MKDRIYLSPPHMGGNEIKYVQEAFDTNWIAPLGPNVDRFEHELAFYNNMEHCAALSSGSAALHLALIILGVEQGDEVLCSSFTFAATANAIAYQKAVPVFVDSEPETWNMSPTTLVEAIEDRLEQGKKPKALVLVHLYGMPARMEEIVSICHEYDIPIIEDAAEALGSKYRDKPIGSFGDIGVYSFNGNKIITTSGGGALVSYTEDYVKTARFLATQARDNAPHYQHSTIGYNYRMSNIVAGIGRGQLEVLDQWVAKRRENHMWYKELFADYPFIGVFEEPDDDFYSNHWLTCIVVNENDRGINRERIRLAMEAENIECRPLWKPMHQQPVFVDHPAYLNGTSDRLFERGLCLPSGSSLSSEERERIRVTLHKALTV